MFHQSLRDLRRVGCIVATAVGLLLALSPAKAQQEFGFTGCLNPPVTFIVNGTTIDFSNYANLSSFLTGNTTISFGFTEPDASFRISNFGGTSDYLQVYGIRGFWLYNAGGISATHNTNTINPHTEPNSTDADTTTPWVTDDLSGNAIGYATENNGFPGGNVTGNKTSNWLAYVANGSVTTSINPDVNKDWHFKPLYGDFGFDFGGGSAPAGTEIIIDVYGQRFDENGNEISGWGGTGKVLIECFNEGGPPQGFVPDGSGIALFCVGGLPFLGLAAYRRRRKA